MAIENAFTRSLSVGRIFSPTAPIDQAKLFAGRQQQLSRVVEAVNQKGQHAIIFGERGVGKTSLANVLSSFLPAVGNRRILTPRINCDSSDTFVTIFEKAFGEIQLIQDIPSIGFTQNAQKKQIDARQFLATYSPDNVRRALTYLSQHFQIVIILDEFDRLSDEAKHNIADTIKTLSDHAVDATLLMVGVADTVDELIKEHASVERALVQVYIPRMSEQEILEIIAKGINELDIEISNDARNLILTLSQGLPHYTHMLCLYACKAAILNEKDTVDFSHAQIAIRQSLENSQQSIQNAYHVATMSPRKDNLFADVLLSCALAPVDQMGYFAAQDIRDPMRRITGKDYEIPSFSQHLNDFCDSKRGPILKKIGTTRRFRFRFINPLVQPFVIMTGHTNGKITIS